MPDVTKVAMLKDAIFLSLRRRNFQADSFKVSLIEGVGFIEEDFNGVQTVRVINVFEDGAMLRRAQGS